MSLDALIKRSNGICELCGSAKELRGYEVPLGEGTTEESILVCGTCHTQLSEKSLDANHFRCLSDSMWSSVPAVQVVAYRTLKTLATANETWAADLLEMMYLDEELQAWANKTLETSLDEKTSTKDSNGTPLLDGDSVTIIKDLDVKGANFVAKRGTLVKNISLTNNPEHIEGRVNGTRIVLLSCFLKKV